MHTNENDDYVLANEVAAGRTEKASQGDLVDRFPERAQAQEESDKFSFEQRAAEKVAARAKDECELRTGTVSSAKMARMNGGGRHQVKLIGPSKRMQELAKSF
ncbi:hypothetical protein [Thioclava sp. IC9]|uniref:hypothetical protein n=1 Tax=Thioclava sp. IC9 TaxID=1973007 RepID=UPI000B5410B1|nr:hypothetical protein [Thioclava sp. IC9]OWY06757.1 hypothetical protein B6V76_02930 [Thioclava sp. IC9]